MTKISSQHLRQTFFIVTQLTSFEFQSQATPSKRQLDSTKQTLKDHANKFQIQIIVKNQLTRIFSQRKIEWNVKMWIFVNFIILILSFDLCACTNNEHSLRNSAEFSSLESSEAVASPASDKHATTAKRLERRNSFLPPQTPSNRNYFREILQHGSNDNTHEYTIDPFYTSYVPQRKQQSQIHGGLPYRMTREVRVKQGMLTGIVREMHVQSRLRNVDQFLGIPYAEAPVGSRRFMPPSSPLPWSETKRANKLEAVCPQKLPNLNDPSGYNKGRYDQIKRLLPYLKRESEDCLYLNLYVTSHGESRDKFSG